MSKFITFNEEILQKQNLAVLRAIGREIGVSTPCELKKEDLIAGILKAQKDDVKPVIKKVGAPAKKIDLSAFYVHEEKVGENDENTIYYVKPHVQELKLSESAFVLEGIFEQFNSGYGFIRINNFENSSGDVFVSPELIKKFNLKNGDHVIGRAVNGKNNPVLHEVLAVNAKEDLSFDRVVDFEKLTACYPDEKIVLEYDKNELCTRAIDLFSPIGFGQRALIVAPPKSGKTTVLKNVATAIEKCDSDAKVLVLLIDERPEEVNDFKRGLTSDVIYSTFDETPSHHVHTAELVLSHAKRLVETGKNVVILLDSLTRLTRAYNNVLPSSGKTLSGGLDQSAIYAVKKFFGSARNIENGGSLTIIATALTDTGSKLDDVVYEEFKGTGNMELHLSRELAEKRVFPAINLHKSGTRKDELLLSPSILDVVYDIKNIIFDQKASVKRVLNEMKNYKNNADFINDYKNVLQRLEGKNK